MGKFEHGNLLLSLSQGHWHGYSLTAVAVGLGIGVAGLCRALNSSLGVQWLLRKFSSESERLYYTGGLQNLGNNCFLNVILQVAHAIVFLTESILRCASCASIVIRLEFMLNQRMFP